MEMQSWYGGVLTKMPLCLSCSVTFPQETLDKILKSKYNANVQATKHKEDTMCCNDRDDFIKFQCKHLDGTNIEMTMPTELTWNELGEQFRNFVSACGYIITREDCLCGAEPEQHIVQAAPMEPFDFDSIFDEIIDEMEVKPKKKSKKKSKKKKGIK
jgi:hypothetical protein